MAVDRWGHTVPVGSRWAAKWCISGALGQAAGANPLFYPTMQTEPAVRAIAQTLQERGVAADVAITTWQDKRGRTHAEVLEVLDVTIDRVRKEEGEHGG